MQLSKGQNADHYFTFVSYLYAERASQRSAGAWQALMQVIAAGGTQAERNEQTLHILQTQLYLRGLCREQAARLLGCRDRLLYDSTISTFVGEHAMPAWRDSGNSPAFRVWPSPAHCGQCCVCVVAGPCCGAAGA